MARFCCFYSPSLNLSSTNRQIYLYIEEVLWTHTFREEPHHNHLARSPRKFLLAEVIRQRPEVQVDPLLHVTLVHEEQLDVVPLNASGVPAVVIGVFRDFLGREDDVVGADELGAPECEVRPPRQVGAPHPKVLRDAQQGLLSQVSQLVFLWRFHSWCLGQSWWPLWHM